MLVGTRRHVTRQTARVAHRDFQEGPGESPCHTWSAIAMAEHNGQGLVTRGFASGHREDWRGVDGARGFRQSSRAWARHRTANARRQPCAHRRRRHEATALGNQVRDMAEFCGETAFNGCILGTPPRQT